MSDGVTSRDAYASKNIVNLMTNCKYSNSVIIDVRGLKLRLRNCSLYKKDNVKMVKQFINSSSD